MIKSGSSAEVAQGDSDENKAPIRVFLVCTGVGIMNRGIETFARECFDGLHGAPGLHLELFKGAGPEIPPDEHRLWCLPRTGRVAQMIGLVIRRNGYVVEQLSSFLPLVREIRKSRPDVIFTSDGNLLRRLHQFRRQIGLNYRLLFSNGAPVRPPFLFADHVQQVAPPYRDEAMRAGEPPEKHSLVPYGIRVPAGAPLNDRATINTIRDKLGLPRDRKVVLSVGWISARQKRMDYTIRELAALPEPRPHLVLLGNMDSSSRAIIQLGHELLGQNFTARSVPYQEVADYYTVSDIFVLASLKEGFGRVYLEALIAGLPCVAHDDEVRRYVLGDEGNLVDLFRKGSMTKALLEILGASFAPDIRARRREYVREKFSWERVTPDYLRMFAACRQTKLTP